MFATAAPLGVDKIHKNRIHSYSNVITIDGVTSFLQEMDFQTEGRKKYAFQSTQEPKEIPTLCSR